MDWNAIAAAYDLVRRGTVSRVDGDGWKVYRVGQLVRIDLLGPRERLSRLA